MVLRAEGHACSGPTVSPPDQTWYPGLQNLSSKWPPACLPRMVSERPRGMNKAETRGLRCPQACS